MAIRDDRPRDTVRIRLGGWFEASATGRFGILTVAVLGLALLGGKAMGWL